MSDQVTSGSSLMPQKKNPDACELLRGKAGRLIGAHATLCTVLKGLPLAYNKDLQEDKEPLFDAMEQAGMCLRVGAVVVDGVTVDRERSREAAAGGYSNATELADYLVGKGVPFREAHDVTGRVVREAIRLGLPLDRLRIETMRAIDQRIGDDVFAVLTIEACLARRDVVGGTAVERVRAAVEAAEKGL
jgi:argininosuccinate lyase